VKASVLFVAVAALAGAPFQCASDPDPNRRMEDSAPEALWELSERFEAKGEHAARRETLRHLVERYPSSRFARRAELELEREGEAAPAAGPEPQATHDDAP
jgi:hypothetical protein